MKTPISKLEAARRNGTTQVDAQRVVILDAAEKLFLDKGIEQTKMTDIAAAVGITRVTLYRYFSDIDSIAFEIAIRMLRRITGSIGTGEHLLSFTTLRTIALRMIDQFYELRDAFRYMGMFDHRYADHYPSNAMAAWYKAQVTTLDWAENAARGEASEASQGQAAMVLNATMSFLQKMAARGHLMAAEQGVPVDEQLQAFRTMLDSYFHNAMSRHRSEGQE